MHFSVHRAPIRQESGPLESLGQHVIGKDQLVLVINQRGND